MKRKVYCCCLAFVYLNILLAGGCGRHKDIIEVKSESEVKDTQAHSLKKQYSENLIVSIEEIPQIETEKIKKQKISKANVDLKQMQEVVFTEDTSEVTVDSPWENVERLMTQEGLLLIQDETILMGRTSEWDSYSDFIGFRAVEELCPTQSTEAELTFLSREDAEERARGIIQQLFPEIQCGEIFVDAYTKEYFTELVANIEKTPVYKDYIKQETKEREWQEKDEIYCVTANLKEDDIPIQKKDISLMDETTIWGSKVIIWLSEKGVQNFEGYGLWKTESSEEVMICSLEDAFEALNRKYQNIVTDEKITITKAELEYAPLTDGISGQQYLTPVWVLSGNIMVSMNSAEKAAEMIELTQEIRVNAETGRLIE